MDWRQTVEHSDGPAMDFVHGDATGLALPAHPGALLEAGPAFLTEAFHRFGSLGPGNQVTRIARFEPWRGGSTGAKALLSIEYMLPEHGLPTELFAKFSRDFADPIRDRGRFEMEPEVRFAAICRRPDFPIAVPNFLFADYHRETGTGLLISSRVAFGQDGIEPQRRKCMDHELTDPASYYRVLLMALARLAGAHKSGRLSAEVERIFPFDATAAAAADKIPWRDDELRAQIGQFAHLATKAPQLFPAHVRTQDFIDRFEREALRYLAHEAVVKRFLQSRPEMIALCHWNAHIDNAWFWRDEEGKLQCGLIDWGRVRQLNLAYALWGCLSAATVELWEQHLDEFLALFLRELHAQGGPHIETSELRLHLVLYIATIGLAGLLITPERILFRLPEAVQASGPHDPIFEKSEQARNLLHIFTNFLHLWQRLDFGANLDLMLERSRSADPAPTATRT